MARLTAELTAWNPTLAINNGDIAYARYLLPFSPLLLWLTTRMHACTLLVAQPASPQKPTYPSKLLSLRASKQLSCCAGLDQLRAYDCACSQQAEECKLSYGVLCTCRGFVTQWDQYFEQVLYVFTFAGPFTFTAKS